jgi:hypothetical protein
VGNGGAGGGQQGAPSGGSGGGGGGLNGGGGGASGCNGSSGGGGGGGASFVTATALHSTPLPPPLDDGGVPSVTISYVSSGPVAQLPAGPVAFGTQPQSTVSTAHTVTVSNTGPAPLHVQGVSFAGAGAADYLVDATGCMSPVAPGSNCPIVVRFAPSAQTSLNATMTVATDGGSPTIGLTGTGGPLPQGPPGAPGAPGPDGAQGATGLTGAQGPPGSVRTVLAVVLGAASYRGAGGKSLTVTYAASTSAIVTFSLFKGRKLVLRSQVVAQAGRNKLKIAHLPKTKGRYTLKLTAVGSGQSASDQAGVTLTGKATKKAKKKKKSSGNNGAVGGGGTT